jgi:hypothetical protein
MIGSRPPYRNYLSEGLLGAAARELTGSHSTSTGLGAGLLALYNAEPHVSGLGAGARELTDPTPNALGSLFGLRPRGGLFAPFLEPAPAPPPQPAPEVRRYVFFSFHFDDHMRANIVRNSWRIRRRGDPPCANFHDRSVWEEFQRKDPKALRGYIIRGMRNSSTTCVLAGTETWTRPWVRFEIAHSLRRGNGLFVTRIHNLRHGNAGPAPAGENPLACMALALRTDGRADIYEWTNAGWQKFELMAAPVEWPRWLLKPAPGYLRQLSAGAPDYDYVLGDGYNNLPAWAQQAAHAAGR